MTDLPAPSPARAQPRHALDRTVVGALLGTVVWLEIAAVGIPRIVAESPGYALVPAAAIAGALIERAPAGRRVLWIAAIALAAILAVVAYTPIMRRPVAALVRADASPPRPIEAIAVLSAGITSDGSLQPQAADRLLTAMSLVRRGVATTLIVSRSRYRRGTYEVTTDADQQRLLSLLERPVRLLIVDSVYSTREEAIAMRALARTVGITSVAVVTSPTHTARACAAFEKVGFAVTCVPSASRDVATGSLRVATDRVRALQLWLYEIAGHALYRARGWI